MKTPSPELYERCLKYWPYRESLKTVVEIIANQTPRGVNLVDLMCGTGFLLARIVERRPDLKLHGVDKNEEYIAYAKDQYPTFNFKVGDVLTCKPRQKFDIVTCTGALHHIPYLKQERVIERIARMMKPKGLAIVSDCYLDGGDQNEADRQIAAARLGYEYLRETIENGAPDEVMDATIDIMRNDIFEKEFKTSFPEKMPIFERNFWDVTLYKTWPGTEVSPTIEHGDYIHVLRGPRR